MYFPTLLLPLTLLTLTTAQTLTPAEIFFQDLQNLDYACKSIGIASSAYTAGADPNPVIDALKAVNTTNRIAYRQVMTIPVQDFKGSTKIVGYVADPIQPDIIGSVKLLNAKKSELEAAGKMTEIRDLLNLITYDHESFSAAVALKLDPLTLVGAVVPVAAIDLAWRDGSLTYTV